ncbi:MAG: peptidoglycan DD-metalloendopeptidase family protein [Bacillus sp. (in: firmicutes)]
MNDNRRREIQNRIKKRKKIKDRQQKSFAGRDEFNKSSYVATYEGKEERNHPLFEKNVFLLKVLLSAALFVAIAIIYKHPSNQLEPVRSAVSSAFEEEMQFAFVSDWYEETFGKPLAFLPSDLPKETTNVEQVTAEYVIPASGTIIETFASNGEGVKVETEPNVKIGAIQEGVVIFAGKKDTTGNTIIIQHRDGSESSYGNLQTMDVKQYDYVENGEKIGNVSQSEDTGTSVLFFAFRKDGIYVDPNQVISFE